MRYSVTSAIKKIAALKKRIRAVQGGTSSSKTISILMLLINSAQSDKTPKLTSVVSETLPHLKKGAIRDFLSIMEGHGYYEEANWNKTDFIYTFETGSKIEFFSADQPTKVRGPRRDRLFLNEANNVDYESFDQLEVRTKERVYLDWNPTSPDFWFYTQVQQRGDVDHITLTYRDNEALDPEFVKAIEQRKNNARWWRVYGEGLVGEIEGMVYRDWRMIDEIPHEARLVVRGLDFGYTHDPSAVVDIYEHDGGYIFDEVCFQKGLSNRQIADILKAQPNSSILTVADSAEPKSIDEIKSYGLTIIPAQKGADSVKYGIQWVQDQKISVTKRSVNVIKEYRNFCYVTDRNGEQTDVPDHNFSHSMDAIRYALTTRKPTDDGKLLATERRTIRTLLAESGLPTIT